MTTVATLYVKLGLDSKGYQSGLDSAKSKTRSLATTLGKGMVAAAAVGATALGGVAIGAGNLIKNAALATARVEELQAVNQVLGEEAGYSSSEITGFAQAVRDEGIQASVAEKTVAEFIRANLDLTKAAEIAKVAQNSAVIAGMDSSEATARIVEGITKLNPLILRNAGVVVDLQAGYKKWAEENDRTVQSLTTAEKQMIATNAVIKAGETVAGAYTAAMETPGKLLRSFPRYFNDIMVSMGGPFQKPFATFLFALKDVTKWVGSMVAEGGALRPLLDMIADGAQNVADRFKAFVEGGGLDELRMKIGVIVGVFKELATTGSISDMGFEALGQILPPGMAKGIEGLFNAFGSVGSMIQPFMAILPIFTGLGGVIFKSLLPAFLQLAEAIGPIIGEFLPPLIETLSNLAMTVLDILLPPFLDLVNLILPIVAELFYAVVGAIMPLVTALLPPLAELFGTLVAAIAPLIMQILPPLAELILVLIDALMPLLMALMPLFIVLVELLLAVILPLLDVILPVLILLLESLANIITIYIVPAFKEFAEWIDQKVVPAFGKLEKALKPVIDWFRDLGDTIAALELPDWLTPGSPTPLELGLLGISDALKKVDADMLPAFTVPIMAEIAAGSEGRGGQSVKIYGGNWSLGKDNDFGSVLDRMKS